MINYTKIYNENHFKKVILDRNSDIPKHTDTNTQTQIQLDINQIHNYDNCAIGLMSRVLANGPGDRGTIPG